MGSSQIGQNFNQNGIWLTGQLDQLVGAVARSHQAKMPPTTDLNSCAAMKHQATGSWASTSQPEQQALVQHLLQTEVQGCSGKPGDKPSIAGAHRLYEQHMRAFGHTEQ